jgi:ABC-2 type transport system permease protein
VEEKIMLQDIGAIFILWLRDLKRYWYDKPRIIASLGQPLLFLFVLGSALSPSFQGPKGVSFTEFIFPGILCMTILFTSVFSGMSIVWDREFGFLREVMVAPVSRWAISIGKAFGGASVAFIQGTIMLSLSIFVGIRFSLPILLASLFVMYLIAFAMSALGIMIAARIKEMEGFQVIVNFLVMPIFFLSGALFPLDRLPAWLTFMTRIDPLTYGVDLLRGVMINVHAFPLTFDLLVLSLFAVGMLAIAVIEFNRLD